MKHVICGFLAAVLCLLPVFSAVRPSIDGRAVVAETDELPSGLFAKAVGYLPGDTVTVTNPSTGVTVDVMVLGALDPSEGIAIKLSQTAADKLFITKNSNAQVKITKRTGNIDESVTGSAVVSVAPDEKKAVSELPDEIKDSVARSEKEEKTAAVPESRTVPKAEEPLADSAEDAKDEISSDTEEMAADTVPAATETAIDENTEKEIDITDKEEGSAETVAKADVADTTDAIVPETDEKALEANTEAGVEDRIVFRLEEPVLAEESVPDTESPVMEEVQDNIEEKSALSEESAEPEKSVSEDEKTENESSVPATEEIALVPADNKSAVMATERTIPESAVDSEIVLVPSDMNPPPEDKSEPVKEKTSVVPEEKKTDTADAIRAEEKSEDILTIVPEKIFDAADKDTKTEPVSETDSAVSEALKADFHSYIVPKLDKLESGKYYVQITISDKEDVLNDLQQKYGTVYPLVYVPRTSGTAYQVMIGPLSVDEYGVVMARFKEYGYTDAFLRKIR